MSREVAAFLPAALQSVATAHDGVRTAGHAAGWAAGWAAGARVAAERAAVAEAERTAEHERAEARRQSVVDDAVLALLRSAQAADRRVLPVVDRVRNELAAAAVLLAEAVLRHELADGETSARSALERALDVPADLGVHTVRLSPADADAVQQLAATGALDLGTVSVVADPRLNRGDAVSEHPAGFLDAQISTALARTRRVLLGEGA